MGVTMRPAHSSGRPSRAERSTRSASPWGNANRAGSSRLGTTAGATRSGGSGGTGRPSAGTPSRRLGRAVRPRSSCTARPSATGCVTQTDTGLSSSQRPFSIGMGRCNRRQASVAGTCRSPSLGASRSMTSRASCQSFSCSARATAPVTSMPAKVIRQGFRNWGGWMVVSTARRQSGRSPKRLVRVNRTPREGSSTPQLPRTVSLFSTVLRAWTQYPTRVRTTRTFPCTCRSSGPRRAA